MALSENDRYILETRVMKLVTPELIAEQREYPFGPQSVDMIEVLDFFRRSPDPTLPRYILVDTEDGFVVAARSSVPGEVPVPVEGIAPFATRGEGEHQIFLLRLTDYGVIE